MLTDKINLLNPMQKKAVLQTEGSLLLLAGAGSGKTRVLTHRIAYIIEKGISPFNILALTFTNKAAKEMQERVKQLIPRGEEVWVSTFHSTCVRILRREINNLEYSTQFTIYDTDDAERVLKEIYKANSINDKILPVKYMINEISRLKDKLISAKQYEEENFQDFRKKDAILIYKEYEKALKSNNALDFDDLILQTVNLFLERPDILEKYQDRFRYIMVDEYQDTSTSQYTLIKLLSSKYKNICVVGDDDQSIYGWRGADIKNILNFEKDFENTITIKLEQNYRSTKTILNAANFVIKNNFARKNKVLWTDNQEGNLIKFNRCNSDREEAIFVANEIKKKVKQGLSYEDFAVLYRNNAISRIIEEQLVYLSIPYRLYGGTNFYSRKEIKDVLAYLKILYNTSDDVSIKRIINLPKRGIGNTTIEKINNYAVKNEISFFDAIKNLEEIDGINSKAKVIMNFYNLIEEFKEYSKQNKVSETIKFILDKIGYILELENECTEEANSRIENIQELINKAIEFEETEEDISLERFLEEVALVSDVKNSDENESTVTLMTLHSSKGLEFPTVFIVGFEEGIFPSYSSTLSGDLSKLEEERRLCYVGITRAKEELYITCAKSRLQRGQYENNLPSRFIKEVPLNYLEDLSKTTSNISKSDSAKNLQSNGNYRPKISYKSNLNSYIKSEVLTPKKVSIDFVVGDSIRHFKFGVGKVEEIIPAGADYEVTINFENVGTKKLMANLSKLQKV